MATLTTDEKRQAERAAEDTIQDAFGSLEAVEFPIDLNIILDRYAISLKKGGFTDETISGAFNRSESTIYVSERESSERQLFTVAHELGHFKLHKDRTTDILYRMPLWPFNNGEAKDETQANWFAANLLMPKQAVKQMWSITHDIEQIAGFFGVSKTAMHFRLKDLGLIS